MRNEHTYINLTYKEKVAAHITTYLKSLHSNPMEGSRIAAEHMVCEIQPLNANIDFSDERKL